MIEIAINAGAMRYKNIYFSVKPSWTKMLGLACFTRCKVNNTLPFLFREPANTKVIDLRVAVNDIWRIFKKIPNTKSEDRIGMDWRLV